MSAIMLNTPATTPAVPAQTFPEIWLGELHVDARDGKTAQVLAKLVPALSNADGSKTLNLSAAVQVNIPDFFATATADELTLMYGLVQALKARAGV
ncbi:MAG: hypothetical protein ABSG86_07700 [Thermoguttaceae bacterium]|jgi:hypothetical protein